ncbi:MAG: class I SAM-dependent methyltransferase [Candidatus Eisenbacteria bacterium]
MAEFGSYYDEPFLAELYDLVPQYTDRHDVEFYVDLCSSTKGRVLELGCGTGRVLIPAAEAGVTIVGLDVSPNMLARCRDHLAGKPADVQARVSLVQASMTDFRLDGEFALLIIPFRPFQHLVAVDDQMACLEHAHAHLGAGGRLVFDVFQVNLDMITDPCILQEREDLPEFELPDGRKLRRCHRHTALHRSEQYNEIEIIYYLTDANGRTERLVQAFPFRYFFRFEIEHMLARCGFRVVEVFGNFDRSPLDDKSPEMIFIAEKGPA